MTGAGEASGRAALALGAPYPACPAEAGEAFRTQGWLSVDQVVDDAELAELRRRCAPMLSRPDWVVDVSASPRAGSPGEGGTALLSMLEMVWVDWRSARFAAWTQRFAEALMGQELDFWYNQLLLKPPGDGAATHWHQDQALIRSAVPDFLISCWMTLDDVGPDGGCMQFLDRSHTGGVIPALADCGESYGLADWDPPAGRRVVTCPLRAGGVTFHHGLTPHRAFANTSDRWRQVIIQRFTVKGLPRPTAH